MHTDPIAIRGNRWIPYSLIDKVIDPTWTTADNACALTVSARLTAKGVHDADELNGLVRCIVCKSKFPGLVYDDVIEDRIRELSRGL